MINGNPYKRCPACEWGHPTNAYRNIGGLTKPYHTFDLGCDKNMSDEMKGLKESVQSRMDVDNVLNDIEEESVTLTNSDYEHLLTALNCAEIECQLETEVVNKLTLKIRKIMENDEEN